MYQNTLINIMADCTDLFNEIVCFTPDEANVITTAPISLFVVAKFDNDGSNPSYVYTDAQMQVVDISTLGTGTLNAGVCVVEPLPTPAVSYEKLCDLKDDGTDVKFYRQCLTSFDRQGNPTTVVTDFEEDKTTAYVVEGTVTPCPVACPPLQNSGLQTAWADLV